MDNNLSTMDLNEMLGLAFESQNAGFTQVKINVNHVVEILDRLLTFENKNSQ